MGGTSTGLVDDDVLSTSDETLNDADKCNISCSVNYQMIPAKLSCFFYQASIGMRNFLVLFYVSCGFDAAQAGSLNGLQLLGGVIATPFLTFLADVTGWHKGIATILCIVAALATNIQPFFDKLYGDPCKNVCPEENHRVNGTMCHTYLSMDQEFISITESNKQKLFYLLILVSIVATGFESSISSFIDGGDIQRIKTRSNQSTYGCQLVFDPIGHAMGGLIYSFSIKYFNYTNIPCNSGMFIAYLFFMLACAFSVGWLFNGLEIEEKGDKDESESLLSLLLSTFRELETIFFFVLILMTGILEGLWFGFLFLRLKELHASTLLLGFSQAFSSISAILMFNTGDKLVNKLQGPMGAMGMTFVLWGLRYIISAVVKTPYLIMSAELLDGVSFMLFKVGSLEYIREKSDPLILTSVCGISNTLMTIGVVFGNVIGGILYRKYGGSILFLWTSIGCFACAFLIVLFVIKKWTTKDSHAYRLIQNVDERRRTMGGS